jgi:hypothetical protein
MFQVSVGGVNTYQATTDLVWQSALIGELANFLGVSPSQIQIVNIVVISPGVSGSLLLTCVLYAATTSQAQSLVVQLGNAVQNTTSPLYSPSNQIIANINPGYWNSNDPNKVNRPYSPSASTGLLPGLSPAAGIAVIVAGAAVVGCSALALGFYCGKSGKGKELSRKASAFFSRSSVDERAQSKMASDSELASVGVGSHAMKTKADAHSAALSPTAARAHPATQQPAVNSVWSKVFDKAHQAYYYYNTETHESRWDFPPLSPEPQSPMSPGAMMPRPMSPI